MIYSAFRKRFFVLLFGSFCAANASVLDLTLEDAVRTALEQNAQLKIGATALQIAQAQYLQAKSAEYPSLDLSLSAYRMDEDINTKAEGAFVLSQDFTNQLALSAADLQDEIVSIQTGIDSHTNLVQMLQLVQQGAVPAQSVPFDMDIKILGKKMAAAELALSYPIYTGGKISAIIKQASLNRKVKSEALRRSRSQVIYDTKKYYYAAILAEKIRKETEVTLERLKLVRDLTEAFYKGDSLKVKKTDYLRTLLTVNLATSMYEQAKSAEKTAKAALINAMGLPWNTEIRVVQKEFAKPSDDVALNALIEDAYRFNPEYGQLRLAIDISDARIDESSSGYLPSIGFQANAKHFYNSFDGGYNTTQNRNSWTIGVGLKWNLFNGFLDREKIEQAKLEKRTLRQKEVVLKEGLALQVKAAFLAFDSALRQYRALSGALENAVENADLNIRAYRADMVSTKDVIEAQLMEAFTKTAYYKSQHDYSANRALLEYIVTSSVEE